MQNKRMLACVGLAALTLSVTGCAHAENARSKLGEVTARMDEARTKLDEVNHRFDRVKAGVDEVNKVIHDTLAEEEAPAAVGEPAHQDMAEGNVPAATVSPEPE
jgi:hypothetical protein